MLVSICFFIKFLKKINLMSKKIALIYGGLGQNGYLLTKFLIKKKYKIYSIIKSNNNSRIFKNITYLKLNINNYANIFDLIKKTKPNEIYNFIGPSDKVSFEKKPFIFFKKDFLLNLYTLESIRLLNFKTKVFYCSSSEVFGTLDRIVSEKSERIIENNYSLTKSINEMLIEFYRSNFNINVCYGILFNHDSIYRKDKFLYKILFNFFDQKKFEKPFLINNINDIKYRAKASEFIKIIWKILQKKKLNDYIISTNKSISVKNLIIKLAKINQIKLFWKKEFDKVKIYNKKKLIIEGPLKKNSYNLKPNLSKIKKDLKIDIKKLSLF